MKKLLLFLVLLCGAIAARAQLTTTVSVNNICLGTAAPISVGFADPSTVYMPGNVFTAELSDAAGSFASPLVIGSTTSVSGSGSIAAVIPASVGAGLGYRIRVTSSAPAITGADNGADIMVVAVPVAPVASSNSPVCAGQWLQLSASTIAGATYSWVGPGITPSNQNQQNPGRPNATQAMSGSYTVYAILNGCTSVGGVTNVVVTPSPAAPVLSSNSPVCAGTQLELSAQGLPGATFTWIAPNATTFTGQTVVIPASSAHNGSWTCTQTINGCTSVPGSVQVTVNPSPAAPPVFSNSPVCEGETLTLSTTFVPGTTYTWTAANGSVHLGNILAITNTLPTDSGQCLLWISQNGCSSQPTIVNAIVAPEPPTPQVFTNSPVCEGQTLTLSTTPIAGASYYWQGPNNTGTYNTQAITIPGAAPISLSYGGDWLLYVVTDYGCISDTTYNPVVVTPITPPVFGYPSSTYCVSAPGTAVPVLANPANNVIFTATPAGLALNDSTGAIDIAASQIGFYTITATGNGGCTSSFSQQVTITVSSSAEFSYPATVYCQADADPIPVFAPGASAGTFTGSTAGLVINPSTGIIDLSASVPGIYQVINTIAASGGCATTSDTATVTIQVTPAGPTLVSNSPLCLGDTLTISASSPTGSSFVWSGPGIAGSYSGQSFSYPNVTAQQAGLYTVQPTGIAGCQPPAATVLVEVIQANNFSLTGTTALVTGQSLYLHASPSGPYTWTGPNGFSTTGSSVYFPHATVAHAGTYVVTSSLSCHIPDSILVQVGPANQITGLVYQDINNNGVQDAGEFPLPGKVMSLNQGQQFTLTNAQGVYSFFTGAGSYTVSPATLLPSQTALPAQYQLTFSGVDSVAAQQDFGIYSTLPQDLYTYMYTTGWPVVPIPGFSGAYVVAVLNDGQTTMSGQVKTIPPAQLQVTGYPAGTTFSGDTLSWNFANLLPGDVFAFTISYQVPTSVILGTTLHYQAMVLPVANDQTPANNTAHMYKMVVGSYDPNDKAVSPPGPITPAQVAAAEELTYKIRFQNTGTYYAFNILVADTLSDLLDVSTFRMHGTSHNCNVTLRENGILEFHFPNIMLPDSNMNEPLSHGYIQYSIKPKTTLQLGDEITNTAHIFFDFNEAIVTNTTSTVVALPNGIAEAKDVQMLNVYPNPNNGSAMLRFTAANPAETTVTLLNLLGQEVWQLKRTLDAGEAEIPVDLQQQPAGIYLVRVMQAGKVYSAKLVRQ